MKQWWAQPDHYRWLSGYLGYRNLRGFTRRMMAGITALLGGVPLLTLTTPEGPHTVVGRVISVFVTICCWVMAAMWLTGWPSRRRSVLFVLQFSPGMALLGCTAFAALAGYVAFFHTSRYLALILVTAAATSLVCAVQLAMGGHSRVAVASLLIIAITVPAVPFSVHVLIHLLGDEALKSHTDPLTGLRNRRGFYRSVRELITASHGPTAPPFLSLIMMDLDRFKQVNDTRGHSSGDRVLVAVADKLRHSTRGRAVVARVGGEEFLIAEMTESGEAHALAERLRQEIAAIPWGATASVGVASITRVGTARSDTRAVIERLVDAADSAMYEAKRAGGNRTRQAEATRIHSR